MAEVNQTAYHMGKKAHEGGHGWVPDRDPEEAHELDHQRFQYRLQHDHHLATPKER